MGIAKQCHTKTYPLIALLLLALFVCCSCKNQQTNQHSNEKNESELISLLTHTKITPNTTAFDFILESVRNENNISLSQYKGKVVLLNFWATWCIPCLEEMPALENLYQLYKDKGLVVLAISVDKKSRELSIRKLLKDNNYSFPVALDPKAEVAKTYSVGGFPETFFISREGNFLPFLDPDTGSQTTRIISDRPWDSKIYKKQIELLLDIPQTKVNEL